MTTKTDFLIVLQTHANGNNPFVTPKERYCGESKEEVMVRCVRSLVRSVNYATSQIPQIEYRLHVIDDNSSEQALARLKNALDEAKFTVTLDHSVVGGLMPSILKCYEYGRDHGKELVYFAQDDYMFYENAMTQMCYTFRDMATALGSYVGVFPYNDPYRYHPGTNNEMLRMVTGRDRFWRTTTRVASCFMTHHDIITQHWDLFHKMGTSEVSSIMEDVSINQLWLARGHFCFSPIPSLALHMGYDTEKDPYADWQAEWNKHGDSKRIEWDDSERVLLNIGCGPKTIKHEIAQLQQYREIRIDADESVSPDIVASMMDLSVIRSKSVAAIWTSHALEHVYWHQSIEALKEFKRVLRDDGVLVMCLPNARPAAQALVDDKMDEPCYMSSIGPIKPIDILFGHRGLIEHNTTFMAHKNCYTAQMLRDDLLAAGFDYAIVVEAGFNIKAVASKSKDVDLQSFMFDY